MEDPIGVEVGLANLRSTSFVKLEAANSDSLSIDFPTSNEHPNLFNKS